MEKSASGSELNFIENWLPDQVSIILVINNLNIYYFL